MEKSKCDSILQFIIDDFSIVEVYYNQGRNSHFEMKENL